MADFEPCKVCASPVHVLPVIHLLQREHPDKFENNDPAVMWNVKLSDLASATKAGCAFCSFVLDRFFHRNNMWSWSKEPNKPWYTKGTDDPERIKAVEHALEIAAGLDNDEFRFDICPSHSSGRVMPDFDRIEIVGKATDHHPPEVTKEIFHIDRATLEVYATEDTPIADIMLTRPPSVTPASLESFDKAREWLHECTMTHTCCGKPQEVQLPTRIIEIGDGTNLRLDMSRTMGHYAALSYCWGGPQEFETTSSTLEDRSKGFNVTQLPKTLQDAVEVTRQLGLKYLWVDSICILQDSSIDKTHEISQMTNIYKEAYVTICAGRAENVNEGFLQDIGDEETHLSRDLFPLAYRIPNQNATTLQEGLRDKEDGYTNLWVREEWPYEPDYDPVTKRAWNLQERLLSPRFIHYGTRMFWQCKTKQTSNGGINFQAHDMLDPAKGVFPRSIPPRSTKITFFGLQNMLQAWYRLVNSYTRREMSVSTDKLPAIAGLAEEVSRITGVAYKAGLWDNNLLHDLMWSCDTDERHIRSTPWRAPTWSWASVDTVISYHPIKPGSMEIAEVLGCEVEPRFPETPYGEVKNGSIKINGPLSKISREIVDNLFQQQGMAPAPIGNDAKDWNARMLEFIKTRGNIPSADQDPNDRLAKLPQEIYCMLTYNRSWMDKKDKQHTSYSGLILEKTADGTFERFGSFANENQKWLSQTSQPWPRETITLV